MKTRILTLCVLVSSFLFAQEKSSFEKLKQGISEKQFYSFIFRNPALQTYLGSSKVSTVNVFYENKKKDFYQIQTPKEYEKMGCVTSAFFPIDSVKTIWGGASYSDINIKEIKWNETADYKLNYPYLTADAVGGAMDVEKYAFNGGISKKYNSIDMGLALDYNGSLSSRDIDPRPKNLSSDLFLKAGLNFRDVEGMNLSFYAKGQRYIQSSDISFHNRQGVSTIYHLSGLGNFNHVIKGSRWKCYYSGYGYGAGATVHLPSKRAFLTFDYDQLTIDKWIKSVNIPTASSLTNQIIDVNFVNFFGSNKNEFAIKLNYKKALKVGEEPTFSIDNAYINTLKTEENYNFHNTSFGFSTLYFTETASSFFKIEPYIDYQRYREKYYLVKSFQFFDKLNIGAKYNYLQKMNDDVFMMSTDFSYSKNLKEDILFRKISDELSIYRMLINNAKYLSQNVFKVNVHLRYTHPLKSKFDLFYAINSDAFVLDSKLNLMYNISTGILF